MKQSGSFRCSCLVFKLWSQSMLISPANRTKRRLYWQSIHASVNIMKIRNFLRSFSLKFSLLNQGCLGVSKNQFKSCSCSTCDKNWKHSVKSSYQRTATYCHLYEICFSAWDYSFANKIDILHEQQKNSRFEVSAQN